MKHRFLALALSAVLTLSLLPTAALAAELPSAEGAVASVTDQDETNYYYSDSLSDAVANAKSGDTVKLLTDVENIG